ncbi:hypothetical protein HED60_00390 [Planctomycetales bacterium ZRK34]|nr:hypothetical protein HED60_00390 [Planctomycetales bacterium ZRK34]
MLRLRKLLFVACLLAVGMVVTGCDDDPGPSAHPVTIYFMARNVAAGEALAESMLQAHHDGQRLLANAPGKTLPLSDFITADDLPAWLGRRFDKPMTIGDPLLKRDLPARIPADPSDPAAGRRMLSIALLANHSLDMPLTLLADEPVGSVENSIPVVAEKYHIPNRLVTLLNPDYRRYAYDKDAVYMIVRGPFTVKYSKSRQVITLHLGSHVICSAPVLRASGESDKVSYTLRSNPRGRQIRPQQATLGSPLYFDDLQIIAETDPPQVPMAVTLVVSAADLERLSVCLREKSSTLEVVE